MLMIRFQRVGRVHEPVFRLVLTDSKNSPKSGNFLEILGSFDARVGDSTNFKVDRIKHWISNGAKTSDTVHNLFVSKKIIEGKKINNLPKKRPVVSEETKAKIAEETKIKAEAEKEANKPKDEVPAEVVVEATS